MQIYDKQFFDISLNENAQKKKKRSIQQGHAFTCIYIEKLFHSLKISGLW